MKGDDKGDAELVPYLTVIYILATLIIVLVVILAYFVSKQCKKSSNGRSSSTFESHELDHEMDAPDAEPEWENVLLVHEQQPAKEPPVAIA